MNAADFVALTLLASIKITGIVREPGVADLPAGVKGKFALAVKHERMGNSEKAHKYLDEAVALLGFEFP